ncbi:hypothetical protein [Paraburkholderia humisilvae]|uniref:Uncharacterized protein n=1 Tax=Paraburkholderia humisilvae TaxID=627669 RepID=A0A6J5ERW9_9BURK|nr:hypothetical protein [Paraburkholderia humisilvae]CAB3769270.1 hypothetical protein LMG29542_06076 [Paraburkholderia humisilvae]
MSQVLEAARWPSLVACALFAAIRLSFFVEWGGRRIIADRKLRRRCASRFDVGDIAQRQFHVEALLLCGFSFSTLGGRQLNVVRCV